MRYMEHAREGLLNLYHFKLRSILALLGVLVGTASVVAMVLGGELATNEALKQFKSLGTDLLAISLTATADENYATVGKVENINLAQALGLLNPQKNIMQVAPYTQIYNPVLYAGNQLNSTVLGVTDSFADIMKIQLRTGRFISFADKYEFYCVIGRDIYDAMKNISMREPLGQHLQIGKNIFVIVGVADAWPENNFLYANVNNAIMIPLLTSTVLSKYATINNIILRLHPAADIEQVKQHLHHVLSDLMSDKQIDFRSAKELVEKMQKQSDILTIFLGLIGSISLIVGGIGVMNIMLVSVVERRREIGIRLAVGAKRSDISALFLVEAVVLSLVGGIFGVMLGILIAYFIAIFSHWEFTLFWWPPISGFGVSVAVGIFFGFYPAYLAAKLDPIAALRME